MEISIRSNWQISLYDGTVWQGKTASLQPIETETYQGIIKEETRYAIPRSGLFRDLTGALLHIRILNRLIANVMVRAQPPGPEPRAEPFWKLAEIC